MEFREKPMQNLIRIKEKEICKNVQALLLDGESIVGAYKTVRDQAVFTSHRIFMVDMQGVTGTRQEIFVLPYRKIVHFGIQTAGFGDPLQTSELTVCYADEHEMKSSAQGLFVIMTNGFGATIGTLGAQAVVNHFVDFNSNVPQIAQWQSAWYVFAIYALTVAVVFAIVFKYKHHPEDLK